MALNTADEILTSLLPEWHQLLQGWSADGSLMAAAQEALMLEGEPTVLRDLVTRWAAGDFTDLPPIVLLQSRTMPGAAGAYAISTGTIYLNQDWLQTASHDWVMAVLTEELGHHLDGVLNTVDTDGDEGERFWSLIENQKSCKKPEFSDTTILRIQASPVNAEMSQLANVIYLGPIKQPAINKSERYASTNLFVQGTSAIDILAINKSGTYSSPSKPEYKVSTPLTTTNSSGDTLQWTADLLPLFEAAVQLRGFYNTYNDYYASPGQPPSLRICDISVVIDSSIELLYFQDSGLYSPTLLSDGKVRFFPTQTTPLGVLA